VIDNNILLNKYARKITMKPLFKNWLIRCHHFLT